MSTSPTIGIFDSGVGGLSVAREIRRQLPHEHLLYFADSAYCPYGGRPAEEIRDRSLAIGGYLIEQGARVLVVACNSASGAALEALRESYPLPVVGMEPAVKPAALTTRTGRIGVMATAATLAAQRFDRLMENYAREVEVVAQPCPGLVELVEEGEFASERVREALTGILEPLRRAEVDAVVLGCTHYPFLQEEIARVLGPQVTLIDSAPAVARQTRRVLEERGMLAVEGEGSLHVVTSGDPERVRPVATRLWGAPLEVERVEV